MQNPSSSQGRPTPSSPTQGKKSFPKASSWSDGRKEKMKVWQPFSRFSIRGRNSDDNLREDCEEEKAYRKQNPATGVKGEACGGRVLSPRAITRKVSQRDAKDPGEQVQSGENANPSSASPAIRRKRRRSLVQALKAGLFGEGDDEASGEEKEHNVHFNDRTDEEETLAEEDESLPIGNRRRSYAMTRNIGYTDVRKLGLQKRVGIVEGQEEIVPNPPYNEANPGEEEDPKKKEPSSPKVPMRQMAELISQSPPPPARRRTRAKNCARRRSIVLILRNPLKSGDSPSSMDAIDEFAMEREEARNNSPRFAFEGFRRQTNVDPALLRPLQPLQPLQPLHPQPQPPLQQPQQAPGGPHPERDRCEATEESLSVEGGKASPTPATKKKRRSLVLKLKDNIFQHAHNSHNSHNTHNNNNVSEPKEEEDGDEGKQQGGGMRWIVTHEGVKEVFDDDEDVSAGESVVEGDKQEDSTPQYTKAQPHKHERGPALLGGNSMSTENVSNKQQETQESEPVSPTFTVSSPRISPKSATLRSTEVDLGGYRAYVAPRVKDGPKEAIQKGQLNRLKQMVPGEWDVNTIDEATGETLLEIACSMSNPSSAIISYLLTSGADDHHTDSNGATALHKLCAASGNSDAIQLLVATGADSCAKDKQRCTALHFLAKHKPENSAEAIRYGLAIDQLLNAGAEINANNLEGQNPVHFAVLYGNSLMLDLILSKAGDIGHVDNFGNTSLHAAVRSDNVDMVEKVLVQKISAELDWGCGTALDLAKQLENQNSKVIATILAEALCDSRARSDTQVENILADAFAAYGDIKGL